MQSCTSSSWSSAPIGLAQPGTAARIRGAICWTRISPACGLIFCFSFRLWNRPSDHGIAFVWRRPLRAGFCRPTNGESLQTLGSAGGLILKKWRLEKFGTTPGLPGVEAGPHRAPPASPDAVPGRSKEVPITDPAERAPCPPRSSTGPARPKRPAPSGPGISTANLQSGWKWRRGMAHRARAHAVFATRHPAGKAHGAWWSWCFRVVRVRAASE